MSLRFSIHRLLITFILLGLFASCLQKTAPRSARNLAKKVTSVAGGNSGSAQNAAAATGSNVLDRLLSGTAVEIRWIYNPYSGVAESKVTIPKNFRGTLYIAGNNISTLSDKLVRVRFKFGRDLAVVEAEGSITRAEGVTPQTDIQVLALHLSGRPFENIRLNYNLFDYNTYTGTQAPVSDPKDTGLYCRALKVEHDPTFEGTLSNTKCDQAGEKCLYSFARIADAGLYYDNTAAGTWTPYYPSQTQIASSSAGYAKDVLSATTALAKCLPDTINTANLEGVLGISGLIGVPYYNMPLTLGGVSYRYRGPYALYDQSSWEISGGALFSDLSVSGTEPSGLFQKSLQAGNAEGGYQSFLFPRSATRTLKLGVEHWGSSDPFAARTLKTGGGITYYMDGCNSRLVDTTAYSQESMSACNVTGLIEIYVKDASTGTETVLATSKDVKLQLVRASATDDYGSEVIVGAMNSCLNSYSCGSSQCCFNNKCWSKNYIPTCVEDVGTTGNVATGGGCNSDYDCASLCCDLTTKTCKAHDTSSDKPSLCSKNLGQSCVAQDWCAKVNIQKCYIVKGVVNEQTGVQACSLRCLNIPTFADCKGGKCVSPVAPAVPAFDPTKPDCTLYPTAVDPATISNI